MLKIQERHDIKKTTNTHPILQEKTKKKLIATLLIGWVHNH